MKYFIYNRLHNELMFFEAETPEAEKLVLKQRELARLWRDGKEKIFMGSYCQFFTLDEIFEKYPTCKIEHDAHSEDEQLLYLYVLMVTSANGCLIGE